MRALGSTLFQCAFSRGENAVSACNMGQLICHVIASDLWYVLNLLRLPANLQFCFHTYVQAASFKVQAGWQASRNRTLPG